MCQYHIPQDQKGNTRKTVSITISLIDRGFLLWSRTASSWNMRTCLKIIMGLHEIGVESQLSEGKDIILEIDWQGAQQVRKLIESAVTIFILPPSYQTLETRLRERGDTDENVTRRMQDAKNELSHYREYNFFAINDDFNTALQELNNIIKVMRHGYAQQSDFYDIFVGQLLNDITKIK